MSDPSTIAELPLEQRLQLRQAAERLQSRFAGRLNTETIERFLADSLDRVSDGARLPNWLPLLAERFAGERLRALVRLEAGLRVTAPAVLFLCVHNAGRSQMAAGSTPSSAMSAHTRRPMSSLIGRMASTPLPAGSSSSQSTYRLPG